MKNKAAFLDRDGVINREIGDYVKNINDFKLNNGVIDSLKYLTNAGYKIFLITNQGGISKGLYSKETLDCIHDVMCEQLNRLNIYIDEIYVCPHHDRIEKCLCRKPSPLMIEKAIARFDISKEHSFMVGDSERDVEAAEKAGIKAYKIEANSNIYNLILEIIK